jgi:hypothetical protein
MQACDMIRIQLSNLELTDFLRLPFAPLCL